MPKPGTLFVVETYAIHLFKEQKTLIDEWVATRKQWAQIFKVRTSIGRGQAFLFLEEKFIIVPDPDDFLGFTAWKVLYNEEIGWIQYSESYIESSKND